MEGKNKFELNPNKPQPSDPGTRLNQRLMFKASKRCVPLNTLSMHVIIQLLRGQVNAIATSHSSTPQHSWQPRHLNPNKTRRWHRSSSPAMQAAAPLCKSAESSKAYIIRRSFSRRSQISYQFTLILPIFHGSKANILMTKAYISHNFLNSSPFSILIIST